MLTQTPDSSSFDDASFDEAVPPEPQAPPETAQWESEIAAFETRDRDHPPPRHAVIFAGSSSITNWESPADDFPTHTVLNRGFGGSQIGDSTYYAARFLLRHAPRLIVFYAGDNDLAAGKTVDDVARDFKAFVTRIRRDLPSTRIAYLSIKPSPQRLHLIDDARRANKLIEEWTRDDVLLDFIDVFHSMLNANGKARPELFGPDDLHMNRAGYELWIPLIAPHLK